MRANKWERSAAVAAVAALLAFSLGGGKWQQPAPRQASASSTRMLLPCGTPFGIKLFTNGVVVVGTADLESADSLVNPAKRAGLCMGDIIDSVNGKAVRSNDEVAKHIANSGGKAVRFAVRRNGQALQLLLQPVRSGGVWRAGLWVRDSAAGVGTLTFYDPETGCYAGLGHGVTDQDTGELMPLGSGDIVPVTISGLQKGAIGVPGELHGYFAADAPLGTLLSNCDRGVYGKLANAPKGQAIPLCPAQAVQPGPVEILCTIDGAAPRRYQAEIELLDKRLQQSRNMVLRVTDPVLLAKTGGIVQGMSGSPILQNGRLVGAVTHVLINDPTRGYGILAQQMVENELQIAAKKDAKKAA